MARKQRIIKVNVLVDWNNWVSQHSVIKKNRQEEYNYCDNIIALQQRLAKALSVRFAGHRLRCKMRLYDGWYKERRPTNLRIVFEKLISSETLTQRINLTIGAVSFPDSIELVDRLCFDEKFGLLFHTSRSSGQKMVDTAIVADGLSFIYHCADESVVIVSEDDDFIPAIVAGRALGGDIQILRKNFDSWSIVTDANISDYALKWS